MNKPLHNQVSVLNLPCEFGEDSSSLTKIQNPTLNLSYNHSNPMDIQFTEYTMQQYAKDIQLYGLDTVWNTILDCVIHNPHSNKIFNVANFGQIYELGLSIQDKYSKKSSGQYFTPFDVSCLMASWLQDLDGENICDVGCGTGNLIVAYLNQIGTKAQNLLQNKKIYLYDSNATALKIAQYSIAIRFGLQFLNNIHLVCGDFLDKNIELPKNAKVISNPPYYKIQSLPNNWNITPNIQQSKELYAAFFEKIVQNSTSSVIISPYSFLGGNKFYNLRKVLNNYNGFIISFDNVPGNIFAGKKYGVFNSNTTNSVRAAITVVQNRSSSSHQFQNDNETHNNSKGFRTTHLIRFKTNERKPLLCRQYLESLLSNKRQIVDDKNSSYSKCHKRLQNILDIWQQQSNQQLNNLLSTIPTQYALHIPNTCRYFTTASSKKLNRSGINLIFAKDQKQFNYLYCLINSSFAYWWWRLYDGGITYAKGLLHTLPIFIDILSTDDHNFFATKAKYMIKKENQYIVTKLNAGVKQENIKFPTTIRQQLNQRFFDILGINENAKILSIIHSNSALEDIKH